MKSIVIYYFSGTGNTEIVAEMIRNGFCRLGCNVDMIRIEDVLKGSCELNLKKYDLVGIGCQVIGYGIPNIVKGFIRRMPEVTCKKVFIFRTAGGVAPINYNASKPMIGKLARKGYDAFYERVFSISSNWIVRFDDVVTRQLHEATGRKASIMCREVIQGEKRILKTGLGLKAAMKIVMPAFGLALRLAGKDLAVNKACSQCGLCVRNCPAGNIYEKNGRIRFRFSCSCCMRCIYSCPKDALNFRFLSFFSVPGGYDIKKILNNRCDGNGTLEKQVPPFFKAYIQDDSM